MKLLAVLQWGLVAVILAWCCILVIAFFGDCGLDMFDHIVGLVVLKIMDIGAAYASFKACEWCYLNNHFPSIISKYIKLSMEDDI